MKKKKTRELKEEAKKKEEEEKEASDAMSDPGHLGPQGYSIYITDLAIFSLLRRKASDEGESPQGAVRKDAEDKQEGPRVGG